MKRLIVSAPITFTPETLTSEQQLGLEAVMVNYVRPMPGTKEHDGQIIIDGVMQDNFDPQAIVDLELPFTIMGYWSWNGSGSVETIEPLSENFIYYLPDRVECDSEGNVISTLPPVLHLPHAWAGWPAIEG